MLQIKESPKIFLECAKKLKVFPKKTQRFEKTQSFGGNVPLVASQKTGKKHPVLRGKQVSLGSWQHGRTPISNQPSCRSLRSGISDYVSTFSICWFLNRGGCNQSPEQQPMVVGLVSSSAGDGSALLRQERSHPDLRPDHSPASPLVPRPPDPLAC